MTVVILVIGSVTLGFVPLLGMPSLRTVQRKRTGDKFLIKVLLVAALIIFPGILARIARGSYPLLSGVAAMQAFAFPGFFISALVLLGFSVAAVFARAWRGTLIHLGAAAIPIGAWIVAVFTNLSGWEMAMNQ